MTDIKEKSGVVVKGHIKIHDPNTGEVYVDKRNAIPHENMSIAPAESLATQGMIYEMSFGNGGTSVDPNRNNYLFYI